MGWLGKGAWDKGGVVGVVRWICIGCFVLAVLFYLSRKSEGF